VLATCVYVRLTMSCRCPSGTYVLLRPFLWRNLAA